MTQSGWPGRLTQMIAAEVRRYRDERKMSAQQLADRTAELGMPIPRSVLANLESGRRESVSVAEVLILARALEVPPVLLLFPVGRQEKVEILPGVTVPPWDAFLWLTGSRDLNVISDIAILGLPQHGAIQLFGSHEETRRRWQRFWHYLQDPKVREPEATAMRERMETEEKTLRGIRDQMRAGGLTPPQLPADLADAIGED